MIVCPHVVEAMHEATDTLPGSETRNMKAFEQSAREAIADTPQPPISKPADGGVSDVHRLLGTSRGSSPVWEKA